MLDSLGDAQRSLTGCLSYCTPVWTTWHGNLPVRTHTTLD
jgi:hypothetical protein